jgi:siroheme synthase
MAADTIAIFMGHEQLGYIIRRLISSGMSNETKIANY